jgi:hypothetical protein
MILDDDWIASSYVTDMIAWKRLSVMSSAKEKLKVSDQMPIYVSCTDFTEKKINKALLKGQCHKIFASGFFHESSPLSPQK